MEWPVRPLALDRTEPRAVAPAAEQQVVAVAAVGWLDGGGEKTTALSDAVAMAKTPCCLGWGGLGELKGHKEG